MEELITLGRLIADRRMQLRMTQEEFANEIHVSKAAVAKWETNRGIPDRDNLRKLAELIHVSMNDLYRIIERDKYSDVDLNINITAEVISILESYGYKIIRPNTFEENIEKIQ